jgi:tRNA(fMet)-specific endonuclease VapC
MKFLIDTNICSAYIKGQREVLAPFQQYFGQSGVSAVIMAELTTWPSQSSLRRETRDALTRFLQDLPCLDFTCSVAVCAGELRARRLQSGRPMPFADLIIAAAALAHSLILVTNNTRVFAGIPGLTLQDWTQP